MADFSREETAEASAKPIARKGGKECEH